MNTDRLLKLADFLENSVPPERFDMEEWGSQGFCKTDCKTAGCAAGWAGILFENEGFYLKYSELNYPYPCFGKLRGFDAIEEFFGLDSYNAEEIFDITAYAKYNYEPLTKVVAERIREVIKNNY